MSTARKPPAPPLLYVASDLEEGVKLSEWRRRRSPGRGRGRRTARELGKLVGRRS